MAFITPTQFLNYADQRRVLEYLSDDPDGEAVTIGAYPSNPIILEILQSASDEISSACSVGKKYSLDDLNGLAATTVGGAKLRRLTAQYAWGLLLDRRKLDAEEFSKLAPSYAIAEAQIEKLRLGERLFPIDNADLATLPSTDSLGARTPNGIAAKVGLWGSAAYGDCGGDISTRQRYYD